jgi:HTH-type transcriptional regulator/antitoxin HipB
MGWNVSERIHSLAPPAFQASTAMNLRNAIDVGLVIRERRRALGLDQATLAQRIGVSRQWVVEIERGKPRAEVALVLTALRVLGLAVRAEPRTDDSDVRRILTDAARPAGGAAR